MATVDGGIRRRQPGKSPPLAFVAAAAFAGATPSALPRFPGAIWCPSPSSGSTCSTMNSGTWAGP
uniref:Uncharacterized protein n=1 Tax=Arundo donax TaxID=35708 RepID=A0A0A9ESM3_ARUDO